MTMKIASGLCMDQPNSIAIVNKLRLRLESPIRYGTVRIKPPFIVSIFVVVACNLLLSGAFGVS